MASSAGVPGMTLLWRCHPEGQEMWCGEGSEDGEFCLSCNVNRLSSSGDEQKKANKRLRNQPSEIVNDSRASDKLRKTNVPPGDRPAWDPYAWHRSTHPLAGEDLAWRSSCRQPRIWRCREEGFFPQSGAKPARSWAQDEALKPEATQCATYSQAGDCLDAGGGAAGHASVWQGPGLSLWP